MIDIRPYSREDESAVKLLHERQGLKYELPDLERSTFVVRQVIEENGKITNALFLRKTAEAYWLFDPVQRIRERIAAMRGLRLVVAPIAKRAGFEDIHAFLPPEILERKTLDKTLLNFGWQRMHWKPYRYPL